ncbi:MAG: ATPase [Oscillospiraceae bacterium]|nr:ATPase [Oscillospiraceae bacterium]
MKKYLGIELGSTRIKAVLTDETYAPFAAGAHDWENRLENGYWTYGLDDVWDGIRDAFAKLAAEYRSKTGEALRTLDGLGISAMMHGYLAFDRDGELLVPFRTWRNTTTGQAAERLTEAFGFSIPQRWSVAHLYQAMLNRETHLKDAAFLTTLAGYVHWRLTGQKALGVGDASGMFPVGADGRYNARMTEIFRQLTGLDIVDILPKSVFAGGDAGTLSAAGAALLDPSGGLQPGAPVCPPEGDAGTGMTATNSVAPRRGNVSAGTSVFAMLVLEKPLTKHYREINLVATPAGLPVAMVHGSTCTPDLDAWVKLFGETASLMGAEFTKSELYDALYAEALKGEPDGGGLLSYNYYSGEAVTGLTEGRPLFTRLPDSRMNLRNFMRVQLYACLATLKLGMDILTGREGVKLDLLTGHGGLFKTPGVGQKMMAAALNVPVAVAEGAGEGGAWGAALLAAYRAAGGGMSLEAFLDGVFQHTKSARVDPGADDVAGFEVFLRRYAAGLDIERAAVSLLT